MNRIKVTEKFINKSLEMATDLYGLADINRDTELKRELKYHIKCCEKYLNQINPKYKRLFN